jgi:hypothetical protein
MKSTSIENKIDNLDLSDAIIESEKSTVLQPYMFEAKLEPPVINKTKNTLSPLTELLKNETYEKNEFAQYLKYEAHVN